MNRLINNEKISQSEALASTIVELSDEEMEQVVGGWCEHKCHDWREDDCDRGWRRHLCDSDLLEDLLCLL